MSMCAPLKKVVRGSDVVPSVAQVIPATEMAKSMLTTARGTGVRAPIATLRTQSASPAPAPRTTPKGIALGPNASGKKIAPPTPPTSTQ